jgi:hypothetical protein
VVLVAIGVGHDKPVGVRDAIEGVTLCRRSSSPVPPEAWKAMRSGGCGANEAGA